MSEDIFIFDESGTILKGVKNRAIKSITIPQQRDEHRDWCFPWLYRPNLRHHP